MKPAALHAWVCATKSEMRDCRAHVWFPLSTAIRQAPAVKTQGLRHEMGTGDCDPPNAGSSDSLVTFELSRQSSPLSRTAQITAGTRLPCARDTAAEVSNRRCSYPRTATSSAQIEAAVKLSRTMALPFLTAYDPPATSEGTLDPMGLYQIADQLATRLVPAVRERMQRVRFLTAVAIGSLVSDGMDGDPARPDSAPSLVWEWLVVEALVRTMSEHPDVWGIPGTLVARRALAQHGYLDSRSYLKTPRIFGFHGVYKRLATHSGLVDVHMSIKADGEQLVHDWARDSERGGLAGEQRLVRKWRAALERSLDHSLPRTRPAWGQDDWRELAEALAPWAARKHEKRKLRHLLLADGDRSLGALPEIWRLQDRFNGDNYREEMLHDELERAVPIYATLLEAIRSYERFCRGSQDAFDILLAEAQTVDGRGYVITAIARDEDFTASVHDLSARYGKARESLVNVDPAFQNLFDERFAAFAEPMSAADVAVALCDHHEAVQKGKSAEGKRPWFDRLSRDRLYVRHRYRQPRKSARSTDYIHDYRGAPIRRFYRDLV